MPRCSAVIWRTRGYKESSVHLSGSRSIASFLVVGFAVLGILYPSGAARAAVAPAAADKKAVCADDDTGLKLPAGFCATIFADGIGHARHMAVAPNGVVYVN